MSSRTENLEAIFENMRLMERVIKRDYQQIFSKLRLSPSQLQVLLMLHHGQRFSHKELAKAMQLTPGAITQLLESLDKERYLTRETDPHDRRIGYLSLSKSGKRKLAEVERHRTEAWAGLLSSLEDSELAAYRTITEKMLMHIEHKAEKEKA